MMKNIVLGLGAIFVASCAQNISAQTSVTTTGYVIDENNVTKKVTQEVTTKYRRTTSQGNPDAHLPYAPGDAPETIAIPLAETVMARYPDYRIAYWKDYTYVQGYMFEAMDRLYRRTGDKRYLDYMIKYIDNFVDENGDYKGGPLTNLDNFMTGAIFCTLYSRTGNEKYKKAALTILSHVADYPSSDVAQDLSLIHI